ncbi:TIGR04282 family arsenosugar biosynthesis glycosyltransferase [Fodinibius halophilus]|uniref:Glycosyltransferase n=1 Tax=Fodinibius halophilus TaxID=1736908 RepID=A0A6M1T3L6_9BACT|nr:TIGR04282 family arsenosugar biosynthesis glycosyltransferase [Fodinibius halophilus]NGP88677.1 glycosyltransferase [Fodinibius halophilus]
MNNSQKNVLVVFVKNPEVGKVKTRLAKTVGADVACRVYHQLLQLTRQRAKKITCARQLWYSDYIDHNDEWNEDYFEKKLQQGNGLGERMSHAFQHAFSEGFEQVVLIGSDCAELKEKHLRKAFRTLQNVDVVIGPSKDGGYYLLGMKEYLPGLFENIEWSTSQVFKETIYRIKKLDMTYEVLSELNDIDTEKDLQESSLNLQSQ